MRNPSERWALAARTQAIPLNKNRTLRLLTDDDADDPVDMAAYAYLVTRALRHEHYRLASTEYKLAKRRHMKDNLYKPCDRCGTRMSGWLKRYNGMTEGPRGTAVTIDHIIPLWLVFALELPKLEFDRRNFSVCCSACNQLRSIACQTVGDVRKELGDQVMERLFDKAGIRLPDEYHHTYGYLSKDAYWASVKGL